MTKEIDRLANSIIDSTRHGSVEAGYQLLRNTERNGNLRPSDLENLSDRLTRAGVLPDLALAYLNEQQQQSGKSRHTQDQLGELAQQSHDPVERAMTNSLQDQYPRLSSRDFTHDLGINSGIYNDRVKQAIADRDREIAGGCPITNPPADGRVLENKAKDNSGPMKRDFMENRAADKQDDIKVCKPDRGWLGGPVDRHEDAASNIKVQPGEGYWHVAARAKGIEDLHKMSLQDQKETYALMKKLQEQNHNRVLQPNDNIRVMY